MSTILIIVPRDRWEQAQQTGVYRTESLDSEGFIHCSTVQQVLGSAEKHYRGQTGLVLLCVDPDKVHAEIRYEGRPGGEQYPHIYGPLNCDAVVRVAAFGTGPDGRFILPEGIG